MTGRTHRVAQIVETIEKTNQIEVMAGVALCGRLLERHSVRDTAFGGTDVLRGIDVHLYPELAVARGRPRVGRASGGSSATECFYGSGFYTFSSSGRNTVQHDIRSPKIEPEPSDLPLGPWPQVPAVATGQDSNLAELPIPERLTRIPGVLLSMWLRCFGSWDHWIYNKALSEVPRYGVFHAGFRGTFAQYHNDPVALGGTGT